MIVVQVMLAILWVVFFTGATATFAVSAGIQGAGLSKRDAVPFGILFIVWGIFAALTGAPLVLWIM